MESGKSSRDQVWDVFAEGLALFDEKNTDYGDAWRKHGWRGNLPRLFEKVERVKTLLWRADPRTPAVGDESAVDTLRDMLNTLAFTIINLREEVEYGHEVPRSLRMYHDQVAYTPGDTADFFQKNGLEDTRRVTIDDEVLGAIGEHPVFKTGPDETPVSAGGDVQRKGRPVRDNPQA